MRIRRSAALALVAAVGIILAAKPSSSQDQQAPTPLQLAERVPDGSDLIEMYRAARTVADVEAANASVRERVVAIQTVATDLARLHASSMTMCENVQASHTAAVAAKAKSFSDTLGRIDGELARSVATMRQRIASERSTPTRARDDLNRFTVAAHEFGRFRLQTQESAKAVDSLASNIRSGSASCLPTEIPPLFAEARAAPRPMVSISRPPPAPHKRRMRRVNRALRLSPW